MHRWYKHKNDLFLAKIQIALNTNTKKVSIHTACITKYYFTIH